MRYDFNVCTERGVFELSRPAENNSLSRKS